MKVPAPLLVVASISSVQVGSAIARHLFDDLGAAGVTLLRLALSAVILALITRPRLRTWSRQAWQAAIVLGVVMSGMNLIFYLSLKTVPLGTAVTIEFLGPLLLALAQTRRWVDVVWALLAGGGVALLGLHGGSSAPVGGMLLAFIAGLCWAAYIVGSAHLGGLVPGTGGLTVSLAVAALIVLPFGARGASAVVHRPILLLAAAGVALLSSVISYGLEINALRRIPTRVFGILMSLEPAAAAIAGLLLLGQRLPTVGVVALVLVTLASAGVTLARRDRSVTPAEVVREPV
ncbi:EamA family transporter [Actinoplanes sp. NPDC051411]|uniref:EamA family transporter n=1 Tax=Actinoplanes sp. NPDC051411 TaxID=3155522 RepID=UPI00341B550F